MIKKLLALLLSMMLLCTAIISAQGEHVIIDDYRKYLTQDDYQALNDELQTVDKDRDIGIYFMIADLSDDRLSGEASRFLNGLSASTNIILLVNEAQSSYAIAASGSKATVLNGAKDRLWKAYNDAKRYVDGIRAYYQMVLDLAGTGDEKSGKVYVLDDAGLLSSDQRSSLEKKLSGLSDRYGTDIAIVSTSSLSGKTIRDFADDYYDRGDFRDSGILLVIDMGSRNIYLSTNGKCQEWFGDDMLKQILSRMDEDIGKERYYSAFSLYGDLAGDRIDQGLKGKTVEPQQKNRFTLANLGISALLAGLATMISSLFLKGQLKDVHSERYAGKYVVDKSFVLTGQSDLLVDTKVTRRPRSSNKKRSATVHTSSSGKSHGGAGKRF